MNNTPEITVIIPAYNEEFYIARCLRSLISQNFSKNLYQIIVINDGSTDNTLRILDSFKKDVHIVNNIKNNGLPTSLNKIIKKIKTKYFVRVDADDYVSVYFLQYLFNFMTKNNHIDAIACDYNLIDDNERLLSRKNCMKEPIACGILFKTKQIIDIGLYDESFQIWEEKDLRIRFLEKYSIYRLELPLYRYRKHESNITNNKKESDYFMNKLNLKHKKK